MAKPVHTKSPTVREAYAADLPIMAELHARSFPRAWNAAALGQFVDRPGCLALVASQHAGEAAGGFMIARAAAGEAELLTLCVTPACRRSGLARALLGTAAAMLREANIERLFLEVDEANAAALALYRSVGAVRVGGRTDYYEQGAAAAIFSLAL